MTDRQWFLLAVGVYGFGVIHAIFLWREGFRRDSWVNYALLALGFVLQTMAMLLRGFSLARCPINNLFEVAMFVGWVIVTTYLVLGVWSRLRFLGAFASPVLFGLGILGLMPPMDSGGSQTLLAQGWLHLHATLIFLAYGALGLSAMTAGMFLTQDHDLKFNQARALFSRLPPVQRLEWMAHRLMLGGMLLLTVGLVVGFAWLKHERGVWFQADSKIYWSLVVWVIYGLLLGLREQFAWRARWFAWGAVGAFLYVLLTFWASNLMSALHHH